MGELGNRLIDLWKRASSDAELRAKLSNVLDGLDAEKASAESADPKPPIGF